MLDSVLTVCYNLLGGGFVGKTSNAVKDRWNAKVYDSTLIRIPKGRKADVDAYCREHGLTFNGLINDLLMNRLGLTADQWKEKPAQVETESKEDSSQASGKS